MSLLRALVPTPLLPFVPPAVFIAGLTLPFDVVRAAYAEAVRAGFIERSILKSRDFERAVAATEMLTLGPLARRV